MKNRDVAGRGERRQVRCWSEMERKGRSELHGWPGFGGRRRGWVRRDEMGWEGERMGDEGIGGEGHGSVEDGEEMGRGHGENGEWQEGDGNRVRRDTNLIFYV